MLVTLCLSFWPGAVRVCDTRWSSYDSNTTWSPRENSFCWSIPFSRPSSSSQASGSLEQLSQLKLLCLRKDRETQALGHPGVQEVPPCPHPSGCSRAGTSSPIHLTLGKGKAFPSLEKGPVGHWDGARQGGGDEVSWHCKGLSSCSPALSFLLFLQVQGSSVPVCRWDVKGPLPSFPA